MIEFPACCTVDSPLLKKKNLMEHYNIITMASNWGSNETLKFIYRDYN